LLSAPRAIAIVTHHNPDGDAVGSSLGLAHILTGLGHRVQVVLPNTPPAFLRWLPGSDQALAHDRSPEASERAMTAADLVFALDFNRPDRVRDLEAIACRAHGGGIDRHLDARTCQHDVLDGMRDLEMIVVWYRPYWDDALDARRRMPYRV
jgi:phosphoesterase RecJ-like protein